MSTFDRDDDVRRDESDELHGIAGGWFDRFERELIEDVVAKHDYVPETDAPVPVPSGIRAAAQTGSEVAK